MEKLGDKFLFRVFARLETSASEPVLEPKRNLDLVDEGSKSGLQIDVRIQNVGPEGISSRALLGRFHPDHKEPNLWDSIDYARRLEEVRRKKNEGGV